MRSVVIYARGTAIRSGSPVQSPRASANEVLLGQCSWATFSGQTWTLPNCWSWGRQHR